jgi:hypothetical protein
MGDLIFPDFQSKDRRYTKGEKSDYLLILPVVWCGPVEDTAPSEMPPVWPSFEAPEQDPA